MLLQELVQYSNEVIDGTRPACKKHKWACMRFLNDLKRSESNTEDFQYYFDEYAAEHFLNWMSFFKHSKGVLQGMHIQPDIIQKFIFGNVYGWRHKETKYRRFNKLYWQVGRKNAKSQTLACVGSYECTFGGSPYVGAGVNEVYVAATTREQASIVYDEIVYQVRSSDLADKFKIANKRITHKKTGSFMRAMSKEDRKTGDGYNPQCGITDEFHAHTTTEIYDVLASGAVARQQPLMAIITTAGLDLNAPCYRVEYDLVSKILNPDVDVNIESYFALVNEVEPEDDIKDRNVWIKANPILASYPAGLKSISDRLELALEAPEKMAEFLTKTMNIWVQMGENGYMDMGKYKRCQVNVLPDVKGLPTTVGIDLSRCDDLTSVGFITKLPDKKLVITGHSFIPEEALRRKIVRDKVPYDLWVKQGWVTVTPGEVIDYSYVLQYIIDTYAANNWRKGEAAYDRALSMWLEIELQKYGFIAIDIPQGFMTLSEPTKNLRNRIYEQNAILSNDPVLNWAFSNCTLRTDVNGNICIDKKASNFKIDPVAAIINAYTRVLANETRESIYTKRDIFGNTL